MAMGVTFSVAGGVFCGTSARRHGGSLLVSSGGHFSMSLDNCCTVALTLAKKAMIFYPQLLQSLDGVIMDSVGASAVSQELIEKFSRFKEASALAGALFASGKNKEAAKQCLIAAELVRTNGAKFFARYTDPVIGALKIEWGLYVSAYKYDKDCIEAFKKANDLFLKIKSIEGEKAVEGKKKES